MGCSLTKTVYVDSHYLIDIKDGSNQVYFREARLVRKNSKMAYDLDRVRHPIHNPKSNQGECIGGSFGASGSG